MTYEISFIPEITNEKNNEKENNLLKKKILRKLKEDITGIFENYFLIGNTIFVCTKKSKSKITLETKYSDIEYIEFVKEGDNNILRVVLDKNDGIVNIDDCELVSRSIEEDVDKLVKTEYVLEVSSPGLERQLKNIKLYQKYVGKLINIKLYKKNDFGKEFDCMLEKVDEDNQVITVKINDEITSLGLDEISSAHTVFDFSDTFKEKDTVNLNKLNKFNKK